MFINGCGAISPQTTHEGIFPFEPTYCQEQALFCQEPDYKSRIPTKKLRRMNRLVRMGIMSSLQALEEARTEKPEAIVTGSGLGCMKDTELFLSAIVENREKYLNPAQFIHSTHNTVSSQIAILLQCTGYNQTYVQGAISFESALLDGVMLLEEKAANTILVGGMDELTPNLLTLRKRFGLTKRKICSTRDLLVQDSKGTKAGEGSAFFVMSRESGPGSYARLAGLRINHVNDSESRVTKPISDFLESRAIGIGDLDLCLVGVNGDNRYDRLYDRLTEPVFQNVPLAAYKHLCGEYPTASAFAFWIACNCLKHQSVPGFLALNGPVKKPLNNILIVNRDQGRFWSFVLLKNIEAA